MTEQSKPDRWRRDSPEEDDAVARAEELDRLARWAWRQPFKDLTDEIESTAFDLGAGLQPVLPDETGRRVVGRTETIDGLPVEEWIASNPDERDQRMVCQGCLTVPLKRHRNWLPVQGPDAVVMLCGACLNARPLYPGHRGNDLPSWLRKPAVVRRVSLISDFGIDPVTGRRVDWHAVETILDDEGLHDSHLARFIQTTRPFGYWDLWRVGKIELRS